MTRLFGLALLAGGLGIALWASRAVFGAQTPSCTDQPYAEAQVPGSPRVLLELATTPEERSRGLMFRTSLPEDAGMLFVFEQESSGAFWMRNTLIPLSIAYIDRDGTILDVQDMEPEVPGQPTPTYPPAKAYWYALEVNQGWYAEHGVAVGDVFSFCLPLS